MTVTLLLGDKNKGLCEDSWASFPCSNSGLATALQQTSSWHWEEPGCVPSPFKPCCTIMLYSVHGVQKVCTHALRAWCCGGEIPDPISTSTRSLDADGQDANVVVSILTGRGGMSSTQYQTQLPFNTVDKNIVKTSRMVQAHLLWQQKQLEEKKIRAEHTTLHCITSTALFLEIYCIFKVAGSQDFLAFFSLRGVEFLELKIRISSPNQKISFGAQVEPFKEKNPNNLVTLTL